jgi:hypothetical protein
MALQVVHDNDKASLVAVQKAMTAVLDVKKVDGVKGSPAYVLWMLDFKVSYQSFGR